MVSINTAILDLKYLDLLARGNSRLHRLDATAKVLVTVVFIICVMSYGRYELSGLIPFFIFPLAMMALGSIPPLFILRKLTIILPFVVMVGIFNPLFDRQILLQFGTVGISAGWISLASILIRSILTTGAALLLVGTTGFSTVCQGLERIGAPRVFTVQLLFLYRYIFVLADEASRASHARRLRSCGKKGLGIESYGSLIGHLLLRTWQRAERIHTAMLSRGFTGEIPARRASHFGQREFIFVILWSSLFIILRFQNLSQILGTMLTGLLP